VLLFPCGDTTGALMVIVLKAAGYHEVLMLRPRVAQPFWAARPLLNQEHQQSVALPHMDCSSLAWPHLTAQPISPSHAAVIIVGVLPPRGAL
jgi:hypothetical protein